MSSRNQFMIIGAVVGAVLGALAAYAYHETQRTGGLMTTKRDRGREIRVQAGVADYMKIGTAVYGVIRLIQGLVKEA
ncbi:MAG TPA: hypothetical protein VGA61_04345 [Anaerolineae bacterium]